MYILDFVYNHHCLGIVKASFASALGLIVYFMLPVRYEI